MSKVQQAISPSRKLAVARREAVLEHRDDILELFMCGHSFEQIVGMLKLTESPNYIRYILSTYSYPEYCEAVRARSHTLVEKAVDVARQSISLGDAGGYRVATDVFLKVAARINKEEFGDKSAMEISGKDGKPIVMAAAQLSDEQLMELIARSATTAPEKGE